MTKKFLSSVNLKFDRWLWKTIGHLTYAASSFVHHLIANSEFKLELQSRNDQFGSKSTIFLTVRPWNWSYSPETTKWGHDLCDFDLWPLTLTFCIDIMSVNGNIFCKFHDDTMTGTLTKRCDGWTEGRTDRQTDGRTDGWKEVFLELLVAATNQFQPLTMDTTIASWETSEAYFRSLHTVVKYLLVDISIL